MQKMVGFLVVQYIFISVVIAAEPQVTVKGLKGRIESGKALATFSLSVSSGYIADFMMIESGISRFIDDTGADLGSKPAGKMSDYITMPFFSSISSSLGDGMEKGVYTVEVSSMVKPSPNAKSFELAGELRFQFADYEQTNEIKNVAISEGATFSVGQHKAKVTTVKKKADSLEFDVEFSNVPDDFDFRDVDMLDSAGSEIRMSCSRTKSKFGEGPSTCKWLFYSVEGNPASVTLRCKKWMGLREIRSPYSFKVPVGSGSGEGPQNIVMPVTVVQPEKPAKLDKPDKPETQPAPETKVPVVTPPVQPVGWPLLKISGVMSQGRSGTVFINGQMLGVGESVEGVKIESIVNGAVTLKYQDATKILRSGQSTQ